MESRRRMRVFPDLFMNILVKTSILALSFLGFSSLGEIGVECRAAGPPHPPSGGNINSGTDEITLEDIWKNGKFSQKSVYGLHSMNDGIHYTARETAGERSFIVKHSYETGEAVDTILRSEWLVDANSGDTIQLGSYQFSDDESKIMLPTQVEKIYRYSTREKNYIWDINPGKLSLLSEGAKQRYATFSPKASKVAFVRANNIFIKDAETGTETQVTIDGKINAVINGATDWVYEEEFGFQRAFFWAPDGSKIAFYRFDESGVKEFSMDIYDGLYPSQSRFKYPKAGEDNSKVSIYVYDLNTAKTTNIALGEDYEYIPRIKWTNNPEKLSLLRMNRRQNSLELLIADVATGKVRTVLTEKSDTYIDVTDDLTFLTDDKSFIWTSDKSGYNHIYHYTMTGKLIRQVTTGDWDIASYEGYDAVSGSIFYIGAEQVSGSTANGNITYQDKGSSLNPPLANALVHNLYSIGLDGSNKKLLSARSGSNRVSFSTGHQYYINYRTDANTPNFVTLNRSDGSEIRALEDNHSLMETLKSCGIARQEFFSVKTEYGVVLNGWMIKPQNFNPAKKYPVLMYVYGGPGVQTVTDSWGGNNFLWYQLLAKKGCIIVSVENRGTPGRGSGFSKCTYKELGKLETEDQIAAAKYMQELAFVDPDRIGIWGWSYGGYMTSLCMTRGGGLFKLGIAVAPVTNWRFYDSIYTERFMQTPQENPDGYDDNSPINYADGLKGKYLLIHGTGDDNVHFQNSMEMVRSLVEANKQFEVFFYPDKAHGISGGNTRLHLFTKMTDFIMENL